METTALFYTDDLLRFNYLIQNDKTYKYCFSQYIHPEAKITFFADDKNQRAVRHALLTNSRFDKIVKLDDKNQWQLYLKYHDGYWIISK